MVKIAKQTTFAKNKTLDINTIYQQFLDGIHNATALERIAVVMGIVSVWLSKKENIWVYPVGLINTTIYTYLSFIYHLGGEASVNFYYTVMNVYGWILWTQKTETQEHLLKIKFSTKKEWWYQILFFGAFYMLIYFSLVYLKANFWEGAIPWADALASASAFTGMWLMTRKKVESWYWWIFTNICSIPLYFVKGLMFTSVYYFILLIMAFGGWAAWRKKAKMQ